MHLVASVGNPRIRRGTIQNRCNTLKGGATWEAQKQCTYRAGRVLPWRCANGSSIYSNEVGNWIRDNYHRAKRREHSSRWCRRLLNWRRIKRDEPTMAPLLLVACIPTKKLKRTFTSESLRYMQRRCGKIAGNQQKFYIVMKCRKTLRTSCHRIAAARRWNGK